MFLHKIHKISIVHIKEKMGFMHIIRDKAPQSSPMLLPCRSHKSGLFEDLKEGSYGQSINLSGRLAKDTATM